LRPENQKFQTSLDCTSESCQGNKKGRKEGREENKGKGNEKILSNQMELCFILE
jgi:hypothetical protein